VEANKSLEREIKSRVILSGLLSDKGAPRIILDLLCLKLPFFIGETGRYNILLKLSEI